MKNHNEVHVNSGYIKMLDHQMSSRENSDLKEQTEEDEENDQTQDFENQQNEYGVEENEDQEESLQEIDKQLLSHYNNDR